MLSVKTNLLAKNANRQLKANTNKNSKITEKLSSGYRINRAADDAAGLAISEKMRRQIRGLHQGTENIKDGIGYVQTAEGALNEVHDMLQRMNELAVKSANGTNTEQDRAYIDQEVQALKKEIDRIFDTTTFNERKIWEPNESEQIGVESRPAVTNLSGTTSFSITNANCGVIARSGYNIKATKDDGVQVSWTGHNGKPYSTKMIPWSDIEKDGYNINLGEYFNREDPDQTDLFTNNDPVNGNPLFTYRLNLRVEDMASLDDVIGAIDGKTMSSSESITLPGDFDGKGYSGVYVTSGSLNYRKTYELHVDLPDKYSFDKMNDDFLEPNKTANSGTSNLTSFPTIDPNNIEAARNSSAAWTFSFTMEKYGTVTGTSNSITYYSYDGSDYRPADKDLWWYESGSSKYSKPHSAGGTLGDVMKALTGTRDEYDFGKGSDGTPGLLTGDKGGASRKGGYISLNFPLTSSSGSIGNFYIRVEVGSGDTERSVLEKINAALNKDTVVDLYTQGTYGDSAFIYRPYITSNILDIPVYGGVCNFFVQAGAEAGQHIDIEYESLNLVALGLQKTNVLTVRDSDRAVNEVKNAMRIVSGQRSDFGAYQNRLEHAVNINQNVEENTQAAESLIRDADIADMMMEFSVNNILLQAGISMLTQANQSKQSVLELLGG